MNKKGFTLIEILMVLVILVTITVAGTFGIQSIQKKSEEKSLEELYSEILLAADVYLNENETFTTDLLNKEVDEKCIRIYTLQNEGLLSTSLTNPVTKKLIPGNLCVISYLSEDGTIKNSFNEDVDTKKVTLNVINGISDIAYKNVHHKATFTVTPNEGYLLELESDTCGGTLSGSTYTISNVTSDVECSIEFKMEIPTLYKKLLSDKSTIKTRTDFTKIVSDDNTNTLYKAAEDNTDVYYFAGNATDNWVKFGKETKNNEEKDIYWRIIRTNADDSIRMLYHGVSPEAKDAYIQTSRFNPWCSSLVTCNTKLSDISYMYGNDNTLEELRNNTADSLIKSNIDEWYLNNLTSYTKYLSAKAVYCNDRNIYSGEITTGITNSDMFYVAYKRLEKDLSNITPTYDCGNESDKFTVDSSTGNGKLTYPIALMTADELVYAGGRLSRENTNVWYYINSIGEYSTDAMWWWTMTPSRNDYLYIVRGSSWAGTIQDYDSYGSYGARPVISIKSCVKYSSGDGTASNPYTIKETSSGC